MLMTTLRYPKSLVIALLLATVVLRADGQPAVASEGAAWAPMSSERLVRLPPRYLEKSLEHDFAASGLARALRDADDSLGLKRQTIGELHDAAEQAEGDVRIEIRHRLLAEKQAYVQQMTERARLRRQGLETRRALLEESLARLEADAPAPSPARAELMERQDRARSRFQTASLQADIAAMAAPGVPESRYARDYAANMAAIEKLASAIASHPMNAMPGEDTVPRSRQDAIRDLLGETEAQLALVDQEAEIIGHMARLVALDAAALSADLDPGTAPRRGLGHGPGAAAAVELFVRR